MLRHRLVFALAQFRLRIFQRDRPTYVTSCINQKAHRGRLGASSNYASMHGTILPRYRNPINPRKAQERPHWELGPTAVGGIEA